LKLPFDVIDPGVDETALPGEAPTDLARRLAIAKASSPLAPPSQWVIGSDQVLVCQGHLMGKPHTTENALDQLKLCSNHQATFYTAVCLKHRSKQLEYVSLVATEVVFRDLSASELQRYIELEPALDCAGSFKVEGLGISLFGSVQSSDPTALEGLPLIALTSLMRQAGINLLS
jgi:MAF protein